MSELLQEDTKVLPAMEMAKLASPAKATKKKVAVAMVSNEPTPYRLHVLDRLANELHEADVYNIFTDTIAKPSVPWKIQLGPHMRPVFFPDYALDRKRISWRAVALFFKIRDFLVEHDVKMIILLGYNDLCRALLIRWADKKGIPLVLAADSNVFAEGRIPLAKRLIKRIYIRWILDRIKGLMPMGSCGRAYFRLYKDHNLPEFIFPYEPDYSTLWFYKDEEVAEFQRKYNLAPMRRRLLYCGRLVPVKRVDLLIKSFVAIAAQRPTWDLVIAGDGPLRKELEAMVPAHLRDRVKWLGFLQFNEAAICYRACNVLVHPAEYEPWGLVVIEAVACEIPIVTTSVCGAAVEVVKHNVNGLIVPPRSQEALTEAIREITIGQRAHEMSWPCAAMLEAWRRQADPIDSAREALRHFRLIDSEREFKTVCEDLWRPRGRRNYGVPPEADVSPEADGPPAT